MFKNIYILLSGIFLGINSSYVINSEYDVDFLSINQYHKVNTFDNNYQYHND